MLVPRDPNLAVQVTENRLTLSFAPMLGLRYIAFLVAMVSIPFFAAGFVAPADDYGVRRMDWIGVGIGVGLLFVTIFLIWTEFRLRTSIVATSTGIDIETKWPLGAFRRRLDFVPVQFYLSGSTRSANTVAPALCALSADEENYTLVRFIPTMLMSRQMWAELQWFYKLEDLDVLGEVEHEKLSAQLGRRTSIKNSD